MSKQRLRILCAYHIEEPGFLDSDPEIELEEHEVTVVKTYNEARAAILDPNRPDPPFDIVIADACLRGSDSDMDLPYCPVVLMPYMGQRLVRALGIFIPEHFETQVIDGLGDELVLVAVRDCWTITGQRDWRKMLSKILETYGDAQDGKLKPFFT